MLISVHLPKTAGSSFRMSLESHFGDSLVLDYEGRPSNQSSFARNTDALRFSVRNATNSIDGKCIHGHFMPLKYRWLRTAENKSFVVWLRDPIERLASHYHYWVKDYNPQTAGVLRRRMVEEEWSLERFCFSKEMQNIYTKFFWGFPFNRFDFVGITENYDSDLQYFAANFLGAEIPQSEVNVNPGREGLYIEDKDLRLRLESFHQKDMAIYRSALDVSIKRN